MCVLVGSGCAQVKIKDSEWCGDVGELGASCFHTLSDRERDIPKDDWDKDRVGMLCTSSETFENWQTAIEQLCHETKHCTYDVQEQITAFFRRALAMKGRIP